MLPGLADTPGMSNRYEHLARIINNCGEVAISEIHKDAERFVHSNPGVAELAEYVCMLEEAVLAIEGWADQIASLRRTMARSFMETLNTIAKDVEE